MPKKIAAILKPTSAATTATAPSLTTNRPDKPRTVADGLGDPDCPQCHGAGYLREDVPLGHPHFGKLQLCGCQMEHLNLARAARLRSESNTESLAGKTFENFLPDIQIPDPEARATLRAAFSRCRQFTADPTHEKWILLTGAYGCGKTHLAAAIANGCLGQNLPVLFLNTPDLLDYLREAFSPSAETSYSERFEQIRSVPVLILDDLGTESPTPWATEKLYQLINYRYNARLPTVVTTNKELKDLDQRVASRLSDLEIVTHIHIVAPDFRAGKMTGDISSLSIHAHQTFDTFDLRSELAGEARQLFTRAVQAAHQFAEASDGWLVLAGPYGSGKTHLAAAIANQRILQMKQPALFVTYQDMNDLFRPAGNRETDERNVRLFAQMKNADFLVLDDLPGVITSNFARDKFYQFFNHRYDAQLPTVITTSAEEKELDPRLKSRIFYSDFCQVHILQVGPYRGKKKPAGRKKTA